MSSEANQRPTEAVADKVVDTILPTAEDGTVDAPRPDIPLPPPSRWKLQARAAVLRNLANLGYTLFNRSAPAATKTIWIESTLSTHKGKAKIRLDVYDPRPRHSKEQTAKRPVVITYHGGGYTIGHGTDDARWAKACMDGLGAVVVGVTYRLAPSYPFPTPLEDSADAILWVAQHADELNIDMDRLFLSGFSTGGSLVFSSHMLLHHAQAQGQGRTPRASAASTLGTGQWSYSYDIPHPPKICGIVSFYPILDWTIPRYVKRGRCPKPELTLPVSITELTDAAHLHPDPDRFDPRLSPSVAPDEMVDSLPPIHMVCCENDMLLQEGVDFTERLKQRGKTVTTRVVNGEQHAWDKPPPLNPKPSVAVEYDAALAAMKEWMTVTTPARGVY